MLKVNVASLMRTPFDVVDVKMEGPLSPVELNGDKVVFSGPAKMAVKLTNIQTSILAEGTVQVGVEVVCSRCLEPFILPVETSFSEHYYLADLEGVLDNRQEEWVPFSGDTIDLEPEIIKAILLALPMKVLCRPECKGLCPRCGQNLNIAACQCKEEVDPRLALLRELLGK